MRKTRKTWFFCLLVGLFAFSLAIEEVVQIKIPFQVRRIKGVILSEGGMWPEEYLSDNSSFTLTGPDNQQIKWIIRLKDQGEFDQAVPPGAYRFWLHVPGWTAYEGIIIVSKKAKKDALIRIVMDISS